MQMMNLIKSEVSMFFLNSLIYFGLLFSFEYLLHDAKASPEALLLKYESFTKEQTKG